MRPHVGEPCANERRICRGGARRVHVAHEHHWEAGISRAAQDLDGLSETDRWSERVEVRGDEAEPARRRLDVYGGPALEHGDLTGNRLDDQIRGEVPLEGS